MRVRTQTGAPPGRERIPTCFEYLAIPRSAVVRQYPTIIVKQSLVTLGHLGVIVSKYQSDLVPDLFPNLTFFHGHLECIKRVRNLYAHMFPCITPNDCRLAKREITTLAQHINSRL